MKNFQHLTFIKKKVLEKLFIKKFFSKVWQTLSAFFKVYVLKRQKIKTMRENWKEK